MPNNDTSPPTGSIGSEADAMTERSAEREFSSSRWPSVSPVAVMQTQVQKRDAAP